MAFPYSFSGAVVMEPGGDNPPPAIILARVLRRLEAEGAVLRGGSGLTARVWVPPIRHLGLNLDFTAPISWVYLLVGVDSHGRTTVRFKLTFGRLLLLVTLASLGFLLLDRSGAAWAAAVWILLLGSNYSITAARAFNYIRSAAADERITHGDKRLLLGRSAT